MIEEFVAEQTPEGTDLEYKQALPPAAWTASDKKEFLADVTALANARGGHLVFGVREARIEGRASGRPEAADGVSIENVAHEIQRLEQVIRAGAAPPLSGVEIFPVDGFPNGPMVVIWVPASWARPHMVIYDTTSRFYCRNSSGKYPMDVEEIRRAMLHGSTSGERLRARQCKRLDAIMADEMPVSLIGSARVVLHILPHAALEDGAPVDLSLFEREEHRRNMVPLYADAGWSMRYNIDGVLVHSAAASPDHCHSYLQVYRDGSIEAVASSLVPEPGRGEPMHAAALEKAVLEATRRWLDELDRVLPASVREAAEPVG